MSEDFIIESVENVIVEAKYILKDKKNNWFFLTNTKIEAEFLLDKFMEMQNEINILKSTNMEMEEYLERYEEDLKKGLIERYEYVCEQKEKYIHNVFLARTYDVIKSEIITLADNLGVEL